MSKTKLITLRADQAELIVAPHIGGAICGYRHRIDDVLCPWLRDASTQAIDEGLVSEMSSFPLLPWFGRLRNGTFEFEGQRVTYPSAKPDSPHSIHGIVRNKPWTVQSQQENELLIRYTHAPDAWPYAFVAEQRFVLESLRLKVHLTVTNTGHRVMPVGMGHHPYFVRHSNTTLTAGVGHAWISDEEVMPLNLAMHPDTEALKHGIAIDRHVFDHPFTAWDHVADIHWPDERRTLRMTATQPLDFLVIYSPPGKDWFCAEPVSNTSDAFNLNATYDPTQVGGQPLEPGQTLTSVMTFDVAFSD